MSKKQLGILSAISIVMAITSPVSALDIIKYNGEISYIPLSADSVNRIIFPSNVVTKVYSKEKGVNVAERGNEIFVKWTPLITTESEVGPNGQAVPVEAPKVDYTKAKVIDLFVTTESGTYSLVLKPTPMPPETVVISNAAEDQKKTTAYEIKDSYVDTMEKLVSLGLDFATETPNADLENFKVESIPHQDAMNIDNVMNATLKAKLTGSLFAIYIYEVKNSTDKTINVQAVEFNQLPVVKKLAISPYLNELFPYQKTAIVIVSRNTTEKSK